MTATSITQKHHRWRGLENSIIVYLDSSNQQTDDLYDNLVSQVRHTVYTVKIFTDTNLFADFISDIQHEKVFWIVSNVQGQIIVPLLHALPQLYSVYILSDDISQSWITLYSKVKGVFHDIDSICHHMEHAVKTIEQNIAPISIMGYSTAMDLNQLEPSFLYSQLLKEIVLDMDYTSESKSELVEYCRLGYHNNPVALNIIDEFDKEYQLHTPVWWYSRDIFLYRLLNRALRTQEIDIIWKLGFYIKDLHHQLVNLYSNSRQLATVVYRGQSMLNDEFAKLKNNQGGLLAFNSFLSTSTDRLLSFGFAIGTLDDPSLKAILFEIALIDGEHASSPFASLDGFGYFESENEVLFSMHTIFRIGEISQLESGVWHVKLRLTSDDDADLRRLLMIMRRDVEGSTGLHRLGQLTAKMGQWNKSMEIYEMLLEKTNDNDKPMLASLHHQLGVIYYNRGDLHTALMHYQKSLENSSTFLLPDAARLGPTYTNIGLVLCKLKDLDRGIVYYERALEIEMKAVQSNQEQIAIICNNIGSALQDRGRLSEALDKYEQALQINLSILPEMHPSLAIRYNNIGMGYYDQKDYSKALLNFQTCLKIEQRSLPPNHPSLIRTNINLASTLEKLNRHTEALYHAQQAVEIARYCSHPKLEIYESYLNECRERVL